MAPIVSILDDVPCVEYEVAVTTHPEVDIPKKTSYSPVARRELEVALNDLDALSVPSEFTYAKATVGLAPVAPAAPVAPVAPVAPASPWVPQVKVRSLFLQDLVESIRRIAPFDFFAQALIVDPAALLTPTDNRDAPSTILMPIIKEFLVEDVLMESPNF